MRPANSIQIADRIIVNKIPLSVAIITLNEETNLPDCIKSVNFADQIVVVDSGSSDNTIQIATDFGCEVWLEPWRGGFGAQKQFAIDKCRNSWVLVLDADERIPPETATAISDILTKNELKIAGYSFPRKNFFQGRWIRHAGWWPDRITRLFQKNLGQMTPASVHEAVEVNGSVQTLDVPIEHMTESRLDRLILKIDKYTTLGAREAFTGGRRASAFAAFFRAILAFLQNYILRLGMLDGSQGLTLATLDSVNKFFKYAKLADLCRKAKLNEPR
jgi:(heptosyl)LPS beta-1,4-glucosyltransferase